MISQVEIKQICGVGELLEKYDQILLRQGLNSLEVYTLFLKSRSPFRYNLLRLGHEEMILFGSVIVDVRSFLVRDVLAALLRAVITGLLLTPMSRLDASVQVAISLFALFVGSSIITVSSRVTR